MSADQEIRLWLQAVLDEIERRIRAAVPFVRDGKLDLSSKNIVGTLPPTHGGSGRNDGVAIRGASDYDNTSAPATGQAIVWNGTKFHPATVAGGSGNGSGASVIDPTTTGGDLLYRHPRTVTSLVIGFIGDSITHDVPSGGTQTPAAIAVADLTGSGVTVTASNQAHDATTSGDWTPTSPTGDYTAAKAAFASAGVRVVQIMLGANDAKTAVATTAATYRANLAAICADLVTSGYLVVLANPLSVVPPGPSGLWDSGSNTLLAAYGQQIATLVNGVTVLQGDTAGYGYFQANPSELADGVHPTATGATDLGQLWANALAPLVRGLTGTLALDRLGLGSEGQALLSTSGLPAWGTPHVYSPLTDPSGPALIWTAGGDVIMAP